MKSTVLMFLLLVGVATVCCYSLGNRGSRQIGINCPMVCFRIYDPVCGSDGTTYGNICMMYAAACRSGTTITLVNRGPCGSTGFGPL